MRYTYMYIHSRSLTRMRIRMCVRAGIPDFASACRHTYAQRTTARFIIVILVCGTVAPIIAT